MSQVQWLHPHLPDARKMSTAIAVLVACSWAAAVGAAPHQHDATMSEAEMAKWVADWYAAHPMRGQASAGVPVATFNAAGFSFDLDNNGATVVDTAKIMVGEIVGWHRVNGSHTTTSGKGFEDPAAGTLWDQPLTLASPNFQLQFDTPGEYPFFCRPHEVDEMKGVVVVRTPVGVGPSGGGQVGFTSGPIPNPTRAGITFAFTLDQAARVTAEVFDARGRRVSVALDADFGPGGHSGAWDGRVQGGARASAGVYYLRLRFPGYNATRQVSITR